MSQATIHSLDRTPIVTVDSGTDHAFIEVTIRDEFLSGASDDPLFLTPEETARLGWALIRASNQRMRGSRR